MTGGADLPPATSPGLLFETENNLFLSHSFLGVFLVQQLNLYPNIRANSRDCPGGPVVKKPPSNAGNMGLIPGEGTKIHHVMEQPSPCTTTTELVYSRAHVLHLRSLCSATRETTATRNPHSTITESPCAATKNQCSQK